MKPELLTSCPNTYEQEYFLYVTDCGYTDRDARLLTSELSNLDYRRYTDDPSLRALYEYVKGNSTYNQLIDEHAKIIAGFEKKDSEYVKAIMHTHLENQIEAVRVVIREQE